MDQLVPPAFFAWCQSTALSTWINASGWGLPVIGAMHWTALTILMVCVTIVDLRILGWIRREHSVADVNDTLRPFVCVSLVMAVVSGGAYFMSQAVRCGHSFAFLAASLLFAVAIWTQTTIVGKATGARELAPVRYRKFAAYLSLLSWVAVAVSERGVAVLP